MFFLRIKIIPDEFFHLSKEEAEVSHRRGLKQQWIALEVCAQTCM